MQNQARNGVLFGKIVTAFLRKAQAFIRRVRTFFTVVLLSVSMFVTWSTTFPGTGRLHNTTKVNKPSAVNMRFDLQRNDAEKSLRCVTDQGVALIRSVFKRDMSVELLAELPRAIVEVNAGCFLRDASQDTWAFGQNPVLTHKHSVITCENSAAATTPLRASTCDAAYKVLHAQNLTNLTQRKSGVLACVAPLFGNPAQGTWPQWFIHARRHYSYVLLYVVGTLDAELETHIRNSKDFLQIIPWDMELRVGDVHQEKFSSVHGLLQSPMSTQQLPYYGQYLQLLDCQRRARSLGYSWFQPTEMDLYLGMKNDSSSLSEFIDSVESNYDAINMRLFHRTVLYEDSNHTPLHWFVANETLSEIAPKYIGNTRSTCEAGVHSLVGNCKMKFVQELSAIHMRYVQTI